MKLGLEECQRRFQTSDFLNNRIYNIYFSSLEYTVIHCLVKVERPISLGISSSTHIILSGGYERVPGVPMNPLSSTEWAWNPLSLCGSEGYLKTLGPNEKCLDFY